MKQEIKSQIATRGICPGNGVTVCRNLIAGDDRKSLRSLTPEEWAKIESLTSETPENSGNGFRQEAANFEPVLFKTKKEGQLQVQTGAFTPKNGNLRDEEPLKENDLSNFSKILESAYTNLTVQASSGNMLIQPALIRYRLIDKQGEVVFSSLASTVSAGGWQNSGVMTVTIDRKSDEEFTINPMRLEAEAYSITAEIPGYSEESGVEIVEIQMSQQLHPTNFEESAEVRIADRESNNPVVRVALGGTTSGMQELKGERIERLKKLIARADSGMRTIARVRARERQRLELKPDDSMTPRSERKATDRIIDQEITADLTETNDLKASVNAPNGFAAEKATHNGDTTLYTGITPLPFKGYDPRESVTTDEGNEDIELISTVIFTDGDYVQRRATTKGAFDSIRIMPLAGYPSKNAIAMILEAKSGGRSKSIRRELMTTEDMRASIAITEDLEPITPTEGGISQEGSEKTEKRDDRIILCSAEPKGTTITGATKISGEVRAATSSERSSGTWDNSRGHFYIATSEGIAAVTADGKTGSVRVTSLSGIKARGSFLESEGKTYLPTSEGIVILTGGQVKIASRNPNAKRLYGFKGMILCEDDEGNRYLIDSEGTRYNLTTENGDIAWEGTIKTDMPLKARQMILGLRAKSFKGRIETSGYGKGMREIFTSLSVNRKVAEPIRTGGILSPPREIFGIRIEGQAEYLKLEKAELKFNQ